MIVVLADLAVTEHKTRLDIVDHRVAGLAEQVRGHPVSSAREFVGTHAVEGQGKILGPGGEHPPHVAGIAPAQLAKGRITEHHVLGVAGAHGLGIQPLEGLIELSDQGAVGVIHGQAPGNRKVPGR
ncbi:hypothetical protein D3C84_856490 [compost metagenome]